MATVKRIFIIALRVVALLVNIALIALLIFFAALFFTDSRIFTDFATSCVSCKKPNFVIANPLHDVDNDGKLTVDDLRVTISPTSTEPKVYPELNPTEQQRIAIEKVNEYRRVVGLRAITLNESLNKAAQAHAHYNVSHHLSGHQESKEYDGFTGEWPWDRMKYFGYKNFTYATEVASIRWASHANLLRIDPEWAVNGWVDTVYHRLPIISPNVYEAGFGAYKSDERLGYVMDFANPGFTQNKRIIYYPIDGQQQVPHEFTGDETPDPLPGKKYPVGYPITVTFNGYKNIEIQGTTVTDTNGVEVDCYTLLPFSDKYIRETLAIIPKQPLERGMTYRVSVNGRADGGSIYLEWLFKTKL